jgi:hypothetical protein
MDANDIKYLTAPLFADVLPDGWKSNAGRTAHSAIAFHFNDTADFARCAGRIKPDDAWGDAGFVDDNVKWVGCTVAEAHGMAENGWPAGARTAEGMRDLLRPILPQTPKLTHYDVAGAVPNVARANAGNPVNMHRVHRADSTRTPVITLVAQSSNPANIDQRQMLATATASAAIVDTLEDAGFRVELIAHRRAVSASGFAMEIATRVKAAGDPVNLATLAFGLGHPGTLRVLTFAVACRHREAKPIGPNHGFSVKDFTADAARGIFVIPPAFVLNAGTDPIKAFHAIVASLRTQGCPGIPPAEGMGR